MSPEAVKAMGRKNIRASARLEGHEVPEGHVRSTAVERYLAELSLRAAGEDNLHRDQHATDNDEEDRRDHVLDILASEVWPLLKDGTPSGKSEQEQILEDSPATE